MIQTITSKNNDKIKYANSLKESKYRKRYKQFLCETLKSLKEAISQNLVTDVFTTEWLDIDESINQYLVSEDVLKKISYTQNPEVVFIANIPNIEPKKLERIVYLDEINDPGNMGTIIRTALAFSYDAVVVSENSCSIFNEKVLNATKGAIFKLPVFVGDLKNYLVDYQIIVSSLNEKSVNLDDAKIEKKHVLVLGNESRGVSDEVAKIATLTVKIPIANIDSLNVAVAGGILMAKCSK